MDYSIALFGAVQAAVAAAIWASLDPNSAGGRFLVPLCVPIFAIGLLLSILSLIAQVSGAPGKLDIGSKLVVGFGVLVSYADHLISLALIIGAFKLGSQQDFSILARIGMFIYGVYLNMVAFCHREHFLNRT